MRGVFIVFEGGEGAGKTQALTAVATALEEAGHDVVRTREPGGTPEALALRALLLSQNASWEPVAELLLMTAARVQHVMRVIAPALEAGRIVLCDRFIGSTLAYQGAGRGLAAETILRLHRDFVGDLRPDITLLLDVPPLVGLKRSSRRLDEAALDEGGFEALDLPFHERVRRSFLEQAGKETVIIDAAQDMDFVRTQLLTAVFTRLADDRADAAKG